jgi:hypothetical protein
MAARRSFGSSLHRLSDSHPYAPDCSRQILSRDLEAFVQAIQSKRTVQDLIGVLFAARLLDYEARGRNEHQWQTDDGFCRYVTLLVELGYEPSDIERELLAEWASDDQEAEASP